MIKHTSWLGSFWERLRTKEQSFPITWQNKQDENALTKTFEENTKDERLENSKFQNRQSIFLDRKNTKSQTTVSSFEKN